MSEFGKAINTTVFVKNAPSYAGLGFGGEGFTSFTIAGAHRRRHDDSAYLHPHPTLHLVGAFLAGVSFKAGCLGKEAGFSTDLTGVWHG